MTSYVSETVKNNCYGDVTASYLGQAVPLTLYEYSLIVGLGLGAGVLVICKHTKSLSVPKVWAATLTSLKSTKIENSILMS